MVQFLVLIFNYRLLCLKATFSFSDNFEFSRTKPRSRVVRDLNKQSGHIIEATGGFGIVHIAVGGSMFLIVVSISLAAYTYRRVRVQKTNKGSTAKNNHPC